MPATHPAAPRTPRPAPRLSPRPASLARLRSPCGPTSRASTYNCHSAQCLVGHKEGTPERWVWREGDYFSQFHPRPPRREEAATRTADGMAGAPEERGPGPSAGEQLQQQHVACQVFPERLAQGKSQQGFLSGFFTNNQKCQLMLVKTLQTNPYVKLLLDAMKHSGCAVNRERHFSCEDCNGHVSGGFDASVSQGPVQCAVGFLHFFLKVFLRIFPGNCSKMGQWWSFIVDSLLIQKLDKKHFTYILI
ncbi:mitochondrial inner membrane protease ATP23 homolog isoform X3 [Rousettus aegyptiacus]|uniref:mitochondrial inner membrane protease ATP23 homolog isoform X3 n=1 Tax=Rousettus aegyptiacus TaxID=9407 RepID=UPI00168CC90B|nr:mitochondrial inner membrane protease ATP23 homolog isoform X3 [Rousettus aegyptiacus]